MGGRARLTLAVAIAACLAWAQPFDLGLGREVAPGVTLYQSTDQAASPRQWVEPRRWWIDDDVGAGDDREQPVRCDRTPEGQRLAAGIPAVRLGLLLRRSVDDDDAFLHHPLDASEERVQALQRIAFDCDDVGKVAGCDAPERFGTSE